MVSAATNAYSRGIGPHEAEWVAAAPFWPAADGSDALRRPRLLQFKHEQFMDEVRARLAKGPRPDLSSLEAEWESERVREPGEPEPQAPMTPRLYQPVHGRFYLVTASLVCKAPGLPDRALEPAKGERTAFVLRRVTDQGELAWTAPPGGKPAWVPVTAQGGRATVPDEELLPLFPLSFDMEQRRRRILVGLVPTTSGDTYEDPAVAASALPKLATAADAEYQLRCVYRRTACGGIHPDVVSEPTARFTIASFFDVDAPARPVRIALPIDASAKGLKKYRQAVGFVLSGSMTDLTNRGNKEALKEKDSPDTQASGEGMWIMALPIITICALLVLWVILSLLDIFLGWLSWVRVWVPLKAKGS